MRRAVTVATLAAAATIWTAVQAQMPNSNQVPLIVDVAEPTLSEKGAAGKILFDANCTQCHGANGSGTEQGPPLIHRIYHPGHHGDMAFYRAVREGTRAHHWSFGDMAPQPQVNPGDIPTIIRYIREVQEENGIR